MTPLVALGTHLHHLVPSTQFCITSNITVRQTEGQQVPRNDIPESGDPPLSLHPSGSPQPEQHDAIVHDEVV